MSKIEVNQISSQCGSTLTVGQSGDTVTLAAGATQTGFGRTGTVNWVTTKKTASFTAVSGEGYFVDTSGGAVTMTLPASPSAGNIVGVKDYSGNFQTNNLTIGRNSEPINGSNTADPTISTEGASIFLVYVDASQGWVATQDDSSTFSGENFIVATGGTETTCGDFKIHTFTGPGTFTVCSVSASPADNAVAYMVVAGGGGGGYNPGAPSPDAGRGGGGGAGGFREGTTAPIVPYTASPLVAATGITVTATSYPITVGAGATSSTPVTRGGSSVFSSITSTGGGNGGVGQHVTPADTRPGSPGGSGGGSGTYAGAGAVGSGNTPPVSPPQGQNGGLGVEGPPAYGAGGGGGAGSVGSNGSTSAAGPGGNGTTSSITGASVTRAGGGGGATQAAAPTAGTGGPGGGGAGAALGCAPTSGVAGTTNTGSGGGGAGGLNYGGSGGNGGSGIVVIRYKFQ